ncbi:MAG: D-alanine--D-alanine ligase [Clostridia bacterium]|nr:D-alanine--D-alanine ligase [Clostridia bacterium]
MKITVLAGGLSPERDVSLTSGALIATSLSKSGHEVLLVDLYRGLDCAPEFKKGGEYSYRVESVEPDLEAIKAECGGREEPIGPRVIEACRAADVVFLALHGAIGENGQLQATLDCHGIKAYTGTGYIGALLSMDKDISKRLMSEAGVKNADWVYFDTQSDSYSEIVEKVGFPCIIKPASCGSSVGVARVFSEDELSAAISAAAKYERFLLAEKLIEGREFTVAVLDGRALPPVEIIPKSGFYDYKNKYQSGMTLELCPAPLTEEETARLGELALRAFSALRMEMYGRADFILGKDGEFYCLEVNALPGMTPTSLLPQEAAAVGIGYDELCELLVELAYKKK